MSHAARLHGHFKGDNGEGHRDDGEIRFFAGRAIVLAV
jgi:hypothetical protein